MNPIDVWKRRVPRRYQQLAVEARVGIRQRTDPHRSLPDFLVIGAQRSGTSSMYKYLEHHPCVLSSLRKETEYFSSRWNRGEAWYRGHFPSRARRAFEARRRGFGVLSFEASPNYIFHPLAPARAARLLPHAKLIVLLRNPADRAFSHHGHEMRAGRETLSFEEALDREEARLAGQEARMVKEPGYRSLAWEHYSYQSRGHYAEQLVRWRRYFAPERFLVLRSEDLYANPARSYRRVLSFLGLPDWVPAQFYNHSYLGVGAPPSEPLPPALRRRLGKVFAASNRELCSLLGDDFGWE